MFVETIEQRQGFKIACIEEIAFKKKWINQNKLSKIIKKFKSSNYGNYLKLVLNSKK